MTKSSRTSENQEPVGIVISRGSRREQAPTFLAYVWGSAPETSTTAPEPAGA